MPGIKNMVVLRVGKRILQLYSKVVFMIGCGCVKIFLKMRTGRQVCNFLCHHYSSLLLLKYHIFDCNSQFVGKIQ